MAKELVKAESTDVAVADPALIAEAMVEVDAADMVVPFLKVIQPLSDEMTKGKDKYNPNVHAGDIYDSVTQTIYEKADIIICAMKKYYGEWEGGVRGKLVGKHKVDSTIVKEAVRTDRITASGSTFTDLTTIAGNELIETFGVVCVVKTPDGNILPATFTLSKTAFSVGKNLTTLLCIHQSNGLPVFEMSTISKQNDKGSWFVPKFSFKEYETDKDVIASVIQTKKNADAIMFKNEDTTPSAVSEVEPETPFDNDIV